MDNLATPAAAKRLGAFYTPDELADWVASEIFTAADSSGGRIENVLDPACGDGALLGAMSRFASEPLGLIGIDINPAAAAQCTARFGSAADIRLGDAIDPRCRWADGPLDAVIANPPWGGELPRHTQFYRDSGYRTAYGQFDIFDLFVERALDVTRPGAVLGFILPESVLQPEHETLRKLLLNHTLILVARIGEGVFGGVYRSTIVVVLRNGSATADHTVACLQLTADQRRSLGQGGMHLSQLKKLHSHYVPQARFAGNRQSVFNLTQTEQGYGVFKKFSEVPAFDWSERVFVGRGVEIGKRGITVCCEICGSHRSAPVVREAVRCRLCAAVIQGDSPRHAIISTESGGPEWYPLIVGEDVDRYSASCRRFIKMGVPGIRYKPIDHFAAKKLLIRKTGVGLRTAVDESGSATVQTVFYVVTYSEPDGWLLDYLQGVINSRPILAWYLKWSGENQWRSHPYVTPRVVKELPIADPFADDYVSSICREIATEARRVRRGEAGADYRVDDLVFRLYGLDGVGASWISDALADTDDSLEYFVRMKTSAANGRASEAAPGSSR